MKISLPKLALSSALLCTLPRSSIGSILFDDVTSGTTGVETSVGCILHEVEPLIVTDDHVVVDENEVGHDPIRICERDATEEGAPGIMYDLEGVGNDFFADVEFGVTHVVFSKATVYEPDEANHSGGKIIVDPASTRTKSGEEATTRRLRGGMVDESEERRRRLSPKEGVTDLLVLYGIPGDCRGGPDYNTTSGNLCNIRTPSFYADSLFGTNGDLKTVASQFNACSKGKLQYVPACSDASSAECAQLDSNVLFANGVLEVKIDNNVIGMASGSAVNLVTTAANSILNPIGLSVTSFKQHMVILPDSVSWGGAAAWAYRPGTQSAFRSSYADHMGVQVHEFGHNVGLLHSGYGTGSYNDHSCMQGNPSYGNNGPEVCWNGPNSYTLGWYKDYHKDFDPVNSNDPFHGRLVGVGDWADDEAVVGTHYVVVKISQSGSNDLFVMYNRVEGPTKGVNFFKNEVMVVEGGTDGRQTWLQSHIPAGGEYAIENFSGQSRTLVIKNCRQEAGAPDYSEVYIALDDGTGVECPAECTDDDSCDDNDMCTVNTCSAELGICTFTDLVCDDGDACTDDVCDPITGCSHTKSTCDDGDVCTVDSCVAEVGCSHESIPNCAVMETGQVELTDTIDLGVKAQIEFTHTYNDPVVVAFINTRNGDASVSPRVKDVTSTGCTIYMQEPDHQNHSPETVSYIVAEKGRWELSGGLTFEAGSHSTDRARGKGMNFEGDPISFSASFQKNPAVLHTLNTNANVDWMTSLATSVTTGGFQIAQEYAETSTLNDAVTIATETIGWIAFETGTGINSGNQFIIGYYDDGVSNGVDQTQFIINLEGHENPPDIVVAVIGENGGDGSWARGSGTYSSTKQGVYAEEDQRSDVERGHVSEPFAWASFDTGSVVFGERTPTASPSVSPSSLPTISPSSSPTEVTPSPSVSPSSAPSNSPSSSPTKQHSDSPSAEPTLSSAPSETPPNAIGETGQVELTDTIDLGVKAQIEFRHVYNDPVVVAFINTRNGDASVSPRVKDVTSTGCTIYMQEPDHQNHSPETVSYIVAEKGRWELSGGLTFEAGSHSTDRARGKGMNFEGDPISFSASFQKNPAVLHTLNTNANVDWMTSLATSVTTGGFQIAQEYAETSTLNDAVTIATETIGWIAFETGFGMIGENLFIIGHYDDGVSNGVGQTQFIINLFGYENPPDIVVAVIGENGRDGSWARGSGTYSSTNQGVYAEEDQRSDVERGHASEPFAWAAFERNTDIILVSQQPSNSPSVAPSSVPSLSASPTGTPVFVGETGRILVSNTIDENVQVEVVFRNAYTNPVVVPFINTRNGVESVSPRVKDVTNTGCTIFMQEPDYQGHSPETVSYFVVEAGSHVLRGGLVVEAGTMSTTKIHRSTHSFDGDSVLFSESFDETPAVLHGLVTHNTNKFMASFVASVTVDGFTGGMEAGRSNANSIGETFAWIAFSTGSGSTAGSPFKITTGSDGIADGVDNESPHIVGFSFMGTPDVVASLFNPAGRDGSWARGAGPYSATQQAIYAEEDEVGDSERYHVDELFAVAAFQADTNFVLSN